MAEPRPPRDRRFVYALALTFGVCFLLGFLVSSQLPEVARYVRVQVEKISDKHLPVRLRPGKIELTAFPFGVRIRELKVDPKDEARAFVDAFVVHEAYVTVSVPDLLRGHFRASAIEIDGVALSVRAPKPKDSNGPPLEGLFDAIELVPTDRIAARSIRLSLQTASPAMRTDFQQINLALEKVGAGIAFEISANSVRVRDADETKTMQLSVDAKGLAERGALYLSGASVRMGESYLVANGEARGDVEALHFRTYEAEGRASLQSGALLTWVRETFPDGPKIPAVEGFATVEGSIRKREKQDSFEAKGTVVVEGLAYKQKFRLGRLEAQWSHDKGSISIPKASLTLVGGHLDVRDAKVSTGEKIAFTGHAKVSKLDLHQLLPELGTPKIPVYLNGSGEFPECEGEISPAFKVTCKGSLTAENILVKGDLKTKSRIVAVKRLDAQGEVTFDANQTSYKAELKSPNGRGRSAGTIAYETGFQINYEADQLPFADIETLGELKLEGEMALKGATSGDSHAATFAMEVEGKNLWLEDWSLGDAKSTVSYKSGKLSFGDVSGHYATSRYSADVVVDFIRSGIEIDANAPFIDARDLTAAVARKFKLPVELTGTGQAQAKVSGPFQFNALTYDLKSTLYRGAVAREPYDQARFEVRARKGEVESQRVEITRGSSSIRLEGRGRPSGDIDAVIRGRGIRLENLATIAASGAQLSGLLEFDMGLKGHVLAPLSELKGSLTKSSVGEQAVPDSTFRLKFGKRTIDGGGALLGDAVQLDFVIPLEPDAPFALNASAHDWNFAPVFAALVGPGSRKEFEARLTGNLKLSSPSGGFWNASGSLEAEKFLIKRAGLQVLAPQPILASMRDGRVRIERFALEGDHSSLRATDAPNPTSKLDAQFTGKLDLSIVALLTPFFEDLRGSLSVAFNAKAGPEGTSVLGSAFVERGYLKLFDLPHPFEEIKADALFNERRVLLNSMRADFAGGKVTADGSMEFRGYKDLPLNVNAQIDRVTLNLPDKVLTRGSGRLSFTGNWFPYLMKGNYDVREGMVSMEFESGNAVEGVRRSAFLPASILQENASPLHLDVLVSFPRGIDVKNKLVEGRAIGELRVQGPPGKPSLSGKITTDRETRVTFRESVIFDVLNGTATFDDPNDINPRLYVNARARLTTPQQDYDINLVVQGRAKDPKVSLSSQPPRLEKDIISLLALGAEANALDATASTAPVRSGLSSGTQVAGTGATVGSQLLSKPINEEIKKKTGFNVSLTSSFDDTNNGAVPKVLASRQFTPKFIVQASRSFGQEPRTDARVRYRLSPKFSVLGSWEGMDRSETGAQAFRQQQDPSTLNKVGLDLEYKFEFK